MATINLLNNGSHKSCDDMKKVLAYVMKEAKTLHDGKKLVTGINCLADTAYINMMLTKSYHKKTDGRMYYHLVQSFSPDEKITPELAHKVAVEFAEKQFHGYEIVVGTHVDRDHIHSHIVFNSVGFVDGRKYHSDKNDIQRWRDSSDEVCRKYNLSVANSIPNTGMKQPRAREFRAIEKQNSWKMQLVVMIEEGMRRAKNRADFIRFMEEHGYKVNWTDMRKNITYTTPDGKKCRDNKLHEKKFLKEMMTNEFRIRESLCRGQGRSEEEYRSGQADNPMRDDHRTELECTVDSSGEGTGVDESACNERSNVRVSQSAERDLYEGGELVEGDRRSNFEQYGGKGAIHIRSDGEEISRDGGRIEVTGWEYERSECFGFGECEEGLGRTDEDVFGTDVSPDVLAVPSYDTFGSGARLVANALTIFEPAPQKREEPKRKPHKELKNYQKRDGQGPIMTM